jgi:small subunit ribosomal protein S16
VAIDEHRAREGKPLAILGYWYPVKNEKKVDSDKLKLWLARGAKETETVKKLLSKKA